MPGNTPARTTRLLAVLAVVLGCAAGLLAAPPFASATAAPAIARAEAGKPVVAVPATPSNLGADIEPQWTPYVPQDSCDPAFKPGTKKLIALLRRTYPDVTSQGSYACGTDGSVSEHYEGRAIDWMASVRDKQQHAEALAFIGWLLAPDAQGNDYAMARRLGVMYIIYDNRIWGPWGGGQWQPYGNCAKTPQAAYDNACHRTHVHISLTWNGAMGRTSFWTGKVTPTDYGPCRQAGLSWAGGYSGYNPTPCPDVPGAKAPAGSSAAVKALARYSGVYLHKGSTGPAVSALQNVLGVTTSGNYLAQTKKAVRTFQTKHKLPSTGAMNLRTWKGLLAATTVHASRSSS